MKPIDRIQDLFHRAEALPAADRPAFLEQHCESAAQRAEVQALLEQQATGVDDFSRNLRSHIAGQAKAQSMPERIGPYTIVRQIGEGGMGVVYLASQTTPLRRHVALKLIRQGMVSPHTVARFATEQQALALLDHPYIASVFDAGTTADGQPYFSLEYVEGEAITAYCDRHRLGIDARIRLFRQVCEAVQHAHQKGVVHRDLKPGNILVGGPPAAPIPKVIDFGIAKALEPDRTPRTALTLPQDLLGTLEYMSPEQLQAPNDDIDTRADIYALGVLLYELLVGAPPHRVGPGTAVPLDEAVRRIRTVDPPTPSARLSSANGDAATIAEHRGTDARSLVRRITGDLDWVTMRALDKDRTRRYGNVSDLADDLACFLTHQPVEAGPPSRTYRLRKFVRRNRVAVASGAIVTVALVAATATSLLFAARADDQRVFALQREQDARDAAGRLAKVVDFQSSIFAKINTERMGTDILERISDHAAAELRMLNVDDNDIAALSNALHQHNPSDLALHIIKEHFLGHADEALDRDFGDRPVVEAELRQVMGLTYRDLGLNDDALAHLQRAYALREEELGPEHPDTLLTLTELGHVLTLLSRYDEARGPLFTALNTAREALPDHPVMRDVLTNAATLLRQTDQPATALNYYEEALAISRRFHGEEHPDTSVALNNVALQQKDMGQFEASLASLDAALTAARHVLGDRHPDTLVILTNLGATHYAMDNFELALPYFEEGITIRRQRLGNDHPHTLLSINNTAHVLSCLRRYDEAIPLLIEVVEKRRRILGPDHAHTLNSISNLGQAYREDGQLERALPIYREAFARRRAVMGPDHSSTLITMHNFAKLLNDLGDHDEALALAREALRIRMDTLDPGHYDTGLSQTLLGVILRDRGQLDDALATAETAVATHRRSSLPPGHRRTAVAILELGCTLTHLERFEDAEAALLEAHPMLLDGQGDGHVDTIKCVERLVELYEAWDRPDMADEWTARLPHAAGDP